MILAKVLLIATVTVPANAQSPQPNGRTPPEITVHRRGSYGAGTWLGGEGQHVKEWIAYCQPTISFADAYGIRHYQYNGNPGCEYGLSRRQLAT